ncbi:MAG: kinesin light chain signature [Flavipsychrobacter sp.]|jgi:tetratricopeptide (TPR) repeat protein|nr:kinesin light chain signature [Flavipsychrobacter sp.]
MNEANYSDAIITHNKEEWDRLLFLLQDPEPNVFWINCDTPLLKKPLHDTITECVPKFKPYDIYLNEKSDSLNRIIFHEDKDKIPANALIHVFGMEDAVKNSDFLGTFNFQRDSFFRQTPATIVFWADFDTGTVLMRKAYDFWSWIVFFFDFKTPEELLTARQKGFADKLILEDKEIKMPSKNSEERIRHLEHEWEEFLKSVNGWPSSAKQMKDAVTIVLALAREYRDEEQYAKAIQIIEKLLKGNSDNFTDNQKGLLLNELGLLLAGEGRYDRAKTVFEEAMIIVLKIYGDKSLNAATLQSNLGVIYSEMGDLENAEKVLINAINIYDNFNADSHPNKARDQMNLGTVYLHKEDFEKGKELLEESLNYNIAFYGEDHPIVGKIGANLASAYWGMGDLIKAKKLLEKSINIISANYDEHNLRIANQYYNLGRILHDLNEFENAKHYVRKSFEILRDKLGEENSKTINALKFLKNLEQK